MKCCLLKFKIILKVYLKNGLETLYDTDFDGLDDVRFKMTFKTKANIIIMRIKITVSEMLGAVSNFINRRRFLISRN